MLASLPSLDLFLWATTSLLTLVLFSLIMLQKQHRQIPFFTLYLGINLLQTILQVVVYQLYGFDSNVAYVTVWASQAFVIVTRGFASAEFCHRVLRKYAGVWAMAIRLLLGCGITVLALAVYFGRDGFQLAVMTLEIGTEAFIATLVVGTFLFAHYYEVPLEPAPLLLGLGLGFHSCLKILNDAVLSRYFRAYAGVWNEISMIAFVCVLVTWILAARARATAEAPREPELAPVQVYRELAPAMNRRLKELNEQLIHLWNLEQPKP